MTHFFNYHTPGSQPTTWRGRLLALTAGLALLVGAAPASGASPTTVKATVPTATITGSAAAMPLSFTVTFSQPVTGYDLDDVTPNLNNGQALSFSGSGTTYTIKVAPASSGAVTLSVPASSAQNSSGTSNTDATPLSLTYTGIEQTLTVDTPVDGSVVSTRRPTYTGAVQNNRSLRVYVDGDLISNTFTGFGSSQFFSIPQPTDLTYGSHTVYATSSFNDGLVGGPVTRRGAAAVTRPANIFTVAVTGPTVAISSTATSPTSTSPIPVTVTFSEVVTGFQSSEVNVTNGALSGFGGSGATYTFNVTPTANGTVTVNVAANVAQSTATTNGNSAAPQYSITYTQPVTAAPTVTTPANGSFVATTTPTYTGTAVAGSTVTVFVDGSSIGTTTATGGNFSLTQPSMLSQGSHTVRATAQSSGSAVSGNSNTNTFTVDTTAPTTTISSPVGASGSTTTTAPIPFTVLFSERGTGFDVNNLTITNGTISGFPVYYTGGRGADFNVTPTGAGAVTVSVAAGAFQDRAGNPNTATGPFSITYAQPVTAAPVVSTPANGSSSNNTTPTYTGTAVAGSTVTVFVDGSSIGTTTATGGSFSLTQPTALAGGSHTVYATAQSSGSAVSTNSNTNSFTIITDLVVTSATYIDASTPASGLSYRDITVEDGAVLYILGAELRGSRTVLIQPGGVLYFADGGTLAGAASFTLSEGTTFYISDVAGISANDNTGNIRTTGPRSFSSAVTYIYTQAARATGSGLPGTVDILSILTDNDVTLTAPMAVSQAVVMASGANLNLNGRALTLLSDANGTALVVNGGGQIVGTTGTMQRYIGTNTEGSGYRHYSSPVQADNFNTLEAGAYTPNFSGAGRYNTSPAPGLVTPFPTVFAYNQDRIPTTAGTFTTFDKGFEAIPSGESLLEVGRGYAVQAPGNILVDFTGQFTNDVVTRTGLNRSPNAQGTGVGMGWHLLGNPYPSPIDWATLTIGTGEGNNLQGLDAAVYVVQSSGPYDGTYRTYLAGGPNTDEDNPTIPAGQGFFVRTTTAGTAGTLRLTNDNRVQDLRAQPSFGRGGNDQRPVVRLTLRNAAGTSADKVTLYADAKATAGVDARYDATKLNNPSGLNLSAVAATGEALAIDGRPAFTASTAVALRLSVPVAGSYVLNAKSVANLPAGLVAYLRDAATGQQVNLSSQPTTTVSLAAGLSTRYSVVFAPANALASAPALTAAQVALYPNPAGKAASVSVTLPVAVGTRTARATVLNALGQVVSETTLSVQAGQASGTLRTAGLAAGVYVVRLQAGADTVSKRLVVE